ncbi:FtsX-like permease family protein [Virgibacillus sp. JSM 102003]|uniref:FtsX-like permease family protein n=1 Tax=Virgibacillus sp. JSM 102003 TaxID=1562108 RepID=UPI0035BEFBBB
MTFKQFALNNVKRNTRQYLSYFLSCMFAVTVFFMYAVVMFHPDISNYEFRDTMQRGIIVNEIIIYVFSFLFVLYSTASFIKSRKKEYGLLTTLGISKSQLNRMLVLENTIIGIASIVAGLLLGALLTKLFLMVFSTVLGIDQILPFHLSLKAIGLTALSFFFMFEVNSFAVVWTLRTNSVMEVFRGAKSPKKALKFSWILSTLSIAAIGVAYYLAFTADFMSVFYRMVPILVLIIPGTYFLFTQFSIAFTNQLKRRKGFYYKGLNLLTVSDLTFKLRDNARLLFLVTILSAIAFTSSGVLYGLFQSAEVESERFLPQDVSLIGKGKNNANAFQEEVNNVKNEFDAKNISYKTLMVKSTQVQVSSNEENWNETWLMLYSYSDYKEAMSLQGKDVPFSINNNEVFILLPDIIAPDYADIPDSFSLRSENEQADFSVKTTESQVNGNIYTTYSAVVSDSVFNQFLEVASSNEIYYNSMMNIPNWTSHTETITQTLGYVDREIVYPDSQADFYLTMKEGMSYLFFFGIFISVLFFLAAGSILYFRMYQDIDNDLHHFHSLYRIGLTDQEMKKIATKQLGLLFFIPFLVAAIHAGFAFKILQNILTSSVFLPSGIIISIFFVIHLINFIFIRNIYTAKLKKVM